MSNYETIQPTSHPDIVLKVDPKDDSYSTDMIYVGEDCLLSIGLAGFAYPIIVFAILMPFFLYQSLSASSLFWDDGLFGLLELLCFALFYLAAISLFGLVVALFTGIFSVGFVALANWSLGNPLTPLSLASCAGGMSGFVPIAALFLFDVSLVPPRELFLGFLLGPCLALIVFQTFARLSCRKMLPSDYALLTFDKSQFQISTILAATFWFAVLFTVCRMFVGTNFVWLLLIYVLLQTITVIVANAITVAKLQKSMSA